TTPASAVVTPGSSLLVYPGSARQPDSTVVERVRTAELKSEPPRGETLLTMRRLFLPLLLTAAIFAGWRELRPLREVEVSQAAELVPVNRAEKGKRSPSGAERTAETSNDIAVSIG